MTFGETQFERPFEVFTEENPAPTVGVIYRELQETSAGTRYELPYGQTSLYHLLKKLVLNTKKQIIERKLC